MSLFTAEFVPGAPRQQFSASYGRIFLRGDYAHRLLPCAPSVNPLGIKDEETAMPTKPTMQIFRASEGRVSPNDGNSSHILPMSQATQDGFARLVDAGITEGSMVKSLIDIPGFSLMYVWFKPHYPLPRHSHKQDCLYYIISGSIKLGTEWLGAGDGFFLPDATPYTYAVGDDGVELLEFRQSSDINFKAFDATPAWWDKAEKAIRENRDAWQAITPPRPALSA